MKVYIASSWKNSEACERLKDALEAIGLEVSLFCHPGHRTNNFDWSDFSFTPGDDVVAFMKKHQIVTNAYKEDRLILNNCDALIMVYPAGRSAHLELGTAMGQRKPTFIYGDLSDLQPEVWYMGVDGIYWEFELYRLLEKLKEIVRLNKLVETTMCEKYPSFTEILNQQD